MKALILGDVHGDWMELYTTINRARKAYPDITHIFQVGDFADQWPGERPFKYGNPHLRDELLPFHWLDGNHEDFDMLDRGYSHPCELVHYQPRGSVLEIDGLRIMFFGGASSIDKPSRVEGKSWWPQESIKYSQVAEALGEEGPFDLILSHEHPLDIPYSDRRYKHPFGKSDRQGLQALLDEFHPKFWFFGHHHYHERGIIGTTEWACAPIITDRQYIIWDGTTAIYSWEHPEKKRSRKR